MQISEAKQLTVMKFSCSASGGSGKCAREPNTHARVSLNMKVPGGESVHREVSMLMWHLIASRWQSSSGN